MFQVPSGTPGSGQVEDVYPVEDKICITNVLASSDYAPLDGACLQCYCV